MAFNCNWQLTVVLYVSKFKFKLLAALGFCKVIISFLWAAASQRWSIVEGLRTMALKLDFGMAHNQMFDRYHKISLLFYSVFNQNSSYLSGMISALWLSILRTPSMSAQVSLIYAPVYIFYRYFLCLLIIFPLRKNGFQCIVHPNLKDLKGNYVLCAGYVRYL